MIIVMLNLFVFVSGFERNLLSWKPLNVGLEIPTQNPINIKMTGMMSSQRDNSWTDSNIRKYRYLSDQVHLRETHNSIIPFLKEVKSPVSCEGNQRTTSERKWRVFFFLNFSPRWAFLLFSVCVSPCAMWTFSHGESTGLNLHLPWGGFVMHF